MISEKTHFLFRLVYILDSLCFLRLLLLLKVKGKTPNKLNAVYTYNDF